MKLTEQIRLSFNEDHSDANLRKWGSYICENGIDLQNLLELLQSDRFTAMRFLWMMGGIVEFYPEKVYPVLPHLFAIRKEIGVPNYERSLAKFFWLSGFPPEIEGEAIGELFHWILDGKTITTTKTYVAQALEKHARKFPELKNELRLVLEDQLEKNGVSFQKRAAKILEGLAKDDIVFTDRTK